MRQEVEVIVRLTYEADAGSCVAELEQEVASDIGRLLDADSESRVELCLLNIISIREEAEIYGNG